MRYLTILCGLVAVLGLSSAAWAGTAGYLNVDPGGPGNGDSDAWYVSTDAKQFQNYRGQGCYDFKWQVTNQSPGTLYDVLWVPEFVNISQTNNLNSFYALPYVGGGVWSRTFGAEEGSAGYKGKTVTMTATGQDRWEYLDPGIPQLSPSDFWVTWGHNPQNPPNEWGDFLAPGETIAGNSIDYNKMYPVLQFGDMAVGETKWQQSWMGMSLTIGGIENTGQVVRFEGDFIGVVPEPVTMISGFLAVCGLGAFIRRHMRAPAAA